MRPDDRAAQVIEHLRLLQEWGIEGIEPPPARLRSTPPAPAEPAAQSYPPTQAWAVPVDLFAPAADSTGHRTLAMVRADLGECTRCPLHAGRKTIVFGTGAADADLMFVGEAPGYDEDQQGLPFVGRAGQLLTKIIESIGLRREDVYIANVIKCRPPENRDPEPEEIASCEPFLYGQIAAIRPKVICALGTVAARTLLKTGAPITRLRGKIFEYRGTKLVPTYHPAFLLRSPDKKRDVWEDMKLIRTLLQASK